MREQIFEALVKAIKDSNKFKKVYSGVLPPIPNVKSFPSVAIVIDTEKRERVNITSCTFQSMLQITIMLYGKAKTNAYTDVLSEKIKDLEEIIQKDETLNNLVLDVFVKSIQQDGGILYPYQLAEMTIVAYFRQNI